MVVCMEFTTNIQNLKGIGAKTAALFAKLNIVTVGDLLYHFPRNYETMEAPKAIREAVSGEKAAIQAVVMSVPSVRKIRHLDIVTVAVKDVTGIMNLTFFNMPFLKNSLKPGMTYIFRGQVQENGYGKNPGSKVMEQPKIYKTAEYLTLISCIQPQYSLTKGLTSQTIAKAVKQVLETINLKEDSLPESVRQAHDLMPYQDAMLSIHFPTSREAMLAARRRLAFEEFFFFLIGMRIHKCRTEKLPNHYPMLPSAYVTRFLESLPYQLTQAQQKVWTEIESDMSSEFVMNRLIQGDVGSGKTIVAALALLLCAANGLQGAMMAPTEVLAKQHFETFCQLTKAYSLPFTPVLLTGSMSAGDKKKAYERIASGEANLILGTHAVIQEKVAFARLALVITDEQHRFGVRQRETLAAKGERPHVLVMSATPIPRTLAIILYGDLHLSVIDELPADRLPIKNCVVGTKFRPKAYEFIEKEVAAGRQAYVICPMVEEGEMDGLENVVDYTEKLRSSLPASIQISYLHGKMRSTQKQQIMEDFAAGYIDVLVSTTVIEVGINVPNATVMIVENAERFGLAGLHQLRGRVGRGKHQSYCIFISSSDKKETMERLEILNHSNDGFYIAGEDLRLRGPGDLFGIRQSGSLEFKVGDIYQDADILKEASDAAEHILSWDTHLETPENQGIRAYFTEYGHNTLDFRTI